MAELSVTPYIFFRGNCAEALNFYKGVFGGELTTQTYAEAHQDDPAKRDWIMHGVLRGEVNLMGSDTEKASPEAKKITLSIGGEDQEKMRKMFDALSEGGTVNSPLKKEFWGDFFGQLTDKYGVEWMMNISVPKEG
jgi:PhnB protein